MKPSPVAPVIVGVDGSASGTSAVYAAAALASLYGLPLQVLHAFNWLPGQPEHIDSHPGATAHGLLQQAVATAQFRSPGLSISTRLVEGAPSATLLRQAHTAALLAIGDGGMSSQVCLPTHTSAVHVATRASCTVLVARAGPPPEGAIMVGVNGSPASERVLDFAFDIAARSGTELVVVRATTDATTEDELRRLADLVAVREDKFHITARTRVLAGEPGAVLVAESEQASLVIIGARGLQRYSGLIGSVAQTLLHHSCAPLVLVRGLITPPPDPPERYGGHLTTSTAGSAPRHRPRGWPDPVAAPDTYAGSP